MMRKAFGIVAMVMAVAFMIGWMRSNVCHDYVTFEEGPRHFYELDSLLGRIEWKSHAVDTVEDDSGYENKSDFGTSLLEHKEQARYFLEDGMRSAFLGFQYGYQHGSQVDTYMLLVPYWSIALPLSILSAWLLWRRSNPKTAPVTPPASVEPR